LPDVSIAMNFIHKQLLAIERRKGTFFKGGSLDIMTPQGGGTLDRLRTLATDGNLMVVEGNEGYRLTCVEDTGECTLWKGERRLDGREVNVVFRGPLDLLKVIPKAQMCHIPWYCEISKL